MKNSIALLLLLVAAVHGFPNIPKQNVPERDTLVSQLAVEDDYGNLVPLDLDAVDTENIELTRQNLDDSVLFYLYTVKNPNSAQQLWINDHKTLSQSNFVRSKPTRIVIHGWKNSHVSDSCTLIRDAYLEHGKYNVIVVDWNKISGKSYIYAANRIKIIAGYVGKMIDFLAARGMNTMETLIVGHSLGAHIAGVAARQAKSTLGYVVALDPALPLLSLATAGKRVAKGDAKFVQVIHTNGGALGFARAIGDVDFYPNGGEYQPGCGLNWACSHSRAYQLFAESINSNRGFVGNECKSLILYSWGKCRSNNREIMGGPKPTTKVTKKYYLVTNKAAPYAKGW